MNWKASKGAENDMKKALFPVLVLTLALVFAVPASAEPIPASAHPDYTQYCNFSKAPIGWYKGETYCGSPAEFLVVPEDTVITMKSEYVFIGDGDDDSGCGVWRLYSDLKQEGNFRLAGKIYPRSLCPDRRNSVELDSWEAMLDNPEYLFWNDDDLPKADWEAIAEFNVMAEGIAGTLGAVPIGDAPALKNSSEEPESPAEPEAPDAVPTSQRLIVDGEEKDTEIYNIEGYNYFKLRDMAALLNGTGSQFGVTYDAERDTVVLSTGEAYESIGGELEKGEDKSDTIVPSAQSIEIDGEKAELTAFNIGGYNFFKLRELGEALGFGVAYDEEADTMTVTSK